MRKPKNIFISSANVDMRKAIDGLASIVQNEFKLDPFEDSMFVFRNKSCDKLKILYWDNNGFCLFYKRLEKGKFSFDKHCNDGNYIITNEELKWLIAGINIDEIRKYNKYKSENLA